MRVLLTVRHVVEFTGWRFICTVSVCVQTLRRNERARWTHFLITVFTCVSTYNKIQTACEHSAIISLICHFLLKPPNHWNGSVSALTPAPIHLLYLLMMNSGSMYRFSALLLTLMFLCFHSRFCRGGEINDDDLSSLLGDDDLFDFF